jgi:hypothetical protein
LLSVCIYRIVIEPGDKQKYSWTSIYVLNWLKMVVLIAKVLELMYGFP